MTDMIYQWKAKTRFKGDAQAVGEKLEEMRGKSNGLLTPEVVLVEAKRKKSPLHDVFEWDDQEAARQHRLDQARHMLRSIVVIIPRVAEEKPVRAFVNVTHEDNRGYTSVVHAMSDADLRKQVLRKAWSELQSWKGRYAEYEELVEIFDAIDRSDIAA